jgi:hypothetical protein
MSDIPSTSSAGVVATAAADAEEELLDVFSEPLTEPLDMVANNVNRVYLVTYANADETKFPTRQAFSEAVVKSFGGVNVQHFACCKETAPTTGKPHYHIAINLQNVLRWHGIKKHLIARYGITCNFRTTVGGMYARAYRYVAKSDPQVHIGSILKKHPSLEDMRKKSARGAARANEAYQKKRKTAREAKAKEDAEKKKSKGASNKRIDKFDVVQFVRRHNIHDDEDLLNAANER